MKTIRQVKSSKIVVMENVSNVVQWIIPVTEKSLSEQCEGGLKCCATGKPEKLFRIERMCSVILSANR